MKSKGTPFGRRGGGSKLKPVDVSHICQCLRAGWKCREIAEIGGSSLDIVKRISAGETWWWLPGTPGYEMMNSGSEAKRD